MRTLVRFFPDRRVICVIQLSNIEILLLRSAGSSVKTFAGLQFASRKLIFWNCNFTISYVLLTAERK